MEKIKSKLSLLTALNAIFIKQDDVISKEDKDKKQIADINSASELSEKDKELLIESIRSNIKDIEEQHQKNFTPKNIAKKVQTNPLEAVTKAKREKNRKDLDEQEKN